MIAGISTATLFPELTETAFKFLCDNQIATAEIFINCNQELQEPFIKQLKAMSDHSGTKIISLHPFTSIMETFWFFSEYPRRFDEGAEQYKQYFNAANILGADSVVFHGDSLYGMKLPFHEHLERFWKISQIAQSQGVHICLENVRGFKSQNPLLFQEISKEFPQARYILDIKQATLIGKDVGEYLVGMAGKIHHVHFSDNNQKLPCLPPGEGDFDIDEFLLHLHKADFSGPLLIELYRDNYKERSQLINGYAHLKGKIEAFNNKLSHL